MPRLSSLLRTQRFLSRRRLYLAGTVFAVALLFRLYHIDYRSIWMDEDRQASIAAGGINFDLFFRAAEQQQPPLDYAAEKIGLMIFGWTEQGARMHAALWGASATALFFLLLRSLALHPFALLLGTASFLLNPLLIRYSQEGRPISCGVFFAVLWLMSLLKSLRRPAPESLKKRLLGQSGLFGATLLFWMSVGFQPLVFLATATISLLGTTIVSPRLRRSAGSMLVAVGLAFLVALPVLLLTLREGDSYMAGTSYTDKLVAVAARLVDFSATNYLKRLYELTGPLWIVGAICIPAGIAAAVLKLRRSTLLRREKTVLSFITIFIIAYPFVLNALFFGLVKNHGLEARYYLTVTPALLLFLSVAASQGIERFGTFLAGTPLRKTAAIVLTVAVIVGFSLPTASALRAQYKQRERTDWRGFYALIQKNPDAFGTAYLMNLVPPKKWAPVRFYATRFYYPNTEKHPILLKKVDAMIDDLYFKALVPGSHVYWTIPYGYKSIKNRMFKKSGFDWFRFDRLSVLHLKIKTDPVDEILALFDRAAKKAVKGDAQYKLVELQTELRILAGDKSGAEASLRRLTALDTKEALAETVIAPLTIAVQAMKESVKPKGVEGDELKAP